MTKRQESRAEAPPGSGRKRETRSKERTIGARKGIEGKTATLSISIRSDFTRTTITLFTSARADHPARRRCAYATSPLRSEPGSFRRCLGYVYFRSLYTRNGREQIFAIVAGAVRRRDRHPKSRPQNYFRSASALFGTFATTSYFGSTSSVISYFRTAPSSTATSLSLSR
jgi:hypothetical protein